MMPIELHLSPWLLMLIVGLAAAAVLYLIGSDGAEALPDDDTPDLF